jgi:hypothetical protein
MLNWVPEWFSPSGDRSPEEVADALANVLLSGLMTPAARKGKKRGG